jgi:excisionase family DNA binding protein
MDTTYCTVTQATRRVSIGRSFLYLRLADGSIRSVKAGNKRLIDVSSLDAWAASLPEVPLMHSTIEKGA